jgi:hypothetical protein
MRTTLDIEDDVLKAAKELAEREHRSTGKVLSDLARRGLAVPARSTKSRARLRGGVPVLPTRGTIVTLERVQKLKDEEGV